MASNKATTEAASEDAVLDTKTNLLAELEEHEAEIASPVPATVGEDVGGGTVRETNTVYEDRTRDPAADKVIEYEIEEKDLGNGFILTNVLGAKE